MPHTKTTTCPKCETPYRADACPRCGLIPNKWRGREASEAAPPELHETWQNVLENWDRPGAHALFIERCLAAGAADYAAKKYRGRDGDPVARGQLERLTARLVQNMNDSTNRKKTRPPHRTARALIAVLLAAAVVAGVFWLIAS